VTHETCAEASAPECGGSCAQGEVCVEDTFGDCTCLPLATDCDEAAAPVCGGSCPEDHRCEHEPASDTCRCRDCALDGLVPGAVARLLWSSKVDLHWSLVDCAATYNVYRHAGPFVDSDANGAADDYGSCLASGLAAHRIADGDPVPAGTLFSYVVTGVSGTGVEGGLGTASSGASRPNATPCP
jgi:hypothetical protein